MDTIIDHNINKAIELLNNDELVAIPTETVYGLAGNALKENVVQKIFTVKNRPLYNPLIVHVYALSQIENYVRIIPFNAVKLLEAFSPGPLTLLLPKKNIIPNITTAGLQNVAVRVPNHPLTLALLKALSYPLAAPSANLFGYISPTTAQHVYKQLNKKIPYILDGGPCQTGIESTVVGFNNNGEPVVYRMGAITNEQIKEVCGICLTKEHNKDTTIESPGMIAYHYSPNTKLIAVNNIQEAINTHGHKRMGVITFYKTKGKDKVQHLITLSKNKNLTEAATNLYAAMHTLDEMSLDIIITELLPNEGIGKAINEKIIKAAAK
jgi:L-threonylcarbamoyladenylate synthase